MACRICSATTRWSSARCAAWCARRWRAPRSDGLPGAHHFYITFRTTAPGRRRCPTHLRAQYPEEMTIVLQHQFWDLEVGEDAFSVTLSFNEQARAADHPVRGDHAPSPIPSVKFGLQFQQARPAPPPTAEATTPGRRARRSRRPRPPARTPRRGRHPRQLPQEVADRSRLDGRRQTGIPAPRSRPQHALPQIRGSPHERFRSFTSCSRWARTTTPYRKLTGDHVSHRALRRRAHGQGRTRRR